MTARMSFEEQIRFLLSCVKWSVNGKIDFDSVALECEVVTKGAAAKRYERMVKQAGTQPQTHDGLLGNSFLTPKKNVSATKAPKKRKLDDIPGIIKHNEDEERALPPPKRPRNEAQPEAKQEFFHPQPLPISNYSPYMFHSMMPPQGSYMPRPMPPNMYQGMPFAMPPQMQLFPQRHHAMFPGMHSNHQFMSPSHSQLSSFQYNQSMLPQGQEATSLGLLDDIHNYDFGNGGYEAMLNTDQMAGEALAIEPMTSARPLQQQPTDVRGEVQGLLKAEPRQTSPPPFIHSNMNHIMNVPQHDLQSSTFTSSASTTDDVTTAGTMIADAPKEAEKHDTATAVSPTPKEEGDSSCIFICD